jgi:hypothetical protein
MKVYVDKGKLESHDIQSITDLGGKEFQQVRMWFKDADNVEVLSLADYTKQVRKEVCEEIRSFIEKPENSIYWDCSIYVETEALRKFLDQIQGETNG